MERQISQTARDNDAHTTPLPNCHFISLPSELRNIIYDYVLQYHPDQGTSFALFTSPTMPTQIRNRSSSRPPQLAHTCRQIRDELLSIFYGGRTFTVDRLWDLNMSASQGLQISSYEGMARIRPSLSYLRTIRFWLFSPDSKTSLIIHSFITSEGRLRCAVEDVYGTEVCICRFERCARDVERGVIGLKDDPMLIRFVRAWDLAAPERRADRYSHCGSCGNEVVFLRLTREESRLVVDPDEDVCGDFGIAVP